MQLKLSQRMNEARKQLLLLKYVDDRTRRRGRIGGTRTGRVRNEHQEVRGPDYVVDVARIVDGSSRRRSARE